MGGWCEGVWAWPPVRDVRQRGSAGRERSRGQFQEGQVREATTGLSAVLKTLCCCESAAVAIRRRSTLSQPVLPRCRTALWCPRIQRDVSIRGRDVDGVISQYTKHVKPAFDQFVAPSRKFADVIIPWARSAGLHLGRHFGQRQPGGPPWAAAGRGAGPCRLHCAPGWGSKLELL